MTRFLVPRNQQEKVKPNYEDFSFCILATKEISTRWTMRRTNIPSENDDTTTYDTNQYIGEGSARIHIGIGPQTSKIKEFSTQGEV